MVRVEDIYAFIRTGNIADKLTNYRDDNFMVLKCAIAKIQQQNKAFVISEIFPGGTTSDLSAKLKKLYAAVRDRANNEDIPIVCSDIYNKKVVQFLRNNGFREIDRGAYSRKLTMMRMPSVVKNIKASS